MVNKKTTNIQQNVGSRIREIREKKKFTQAELAEKSGLNRTFLIHVEKGRRNVSIQSLGKILDGLETTFSYFFKNF